MRCTEYGPQSRGLVAAIPRLRPQPARLLGASVSLFSSRRLKIACCKTTHNQPAKN
jgi:hypothetical protein